jgi:hypothetical protein
VVCYFEHGNKTSCSVKGGQFSNHLKDYQLLKEGLTARSVLMMNYGLSAVAFSSSEVDIGHFSL